MTFSQVKIGATFYLGGTHWRKRSSRTAVITQGLGEGSWFYWRQSDAIDHLTAQTATLT